MADLDEFLLARIAEDEATDPQWGFLLNVTLHATDCLEFGAVERSDAKCDCDGPKRWLTECKAKREMVEALDDLVREHENTLCNDEDAEGRYVQRAHFYRQEMLRLLALPYAGHPDYREDWRP